MKAEELSAARFALQDRIEKLESWLDWESAGAGAKAAVSKAEVSSKKRQLYSACAALDELGKMTPTSTELLQSLEDHPTAENAVAIHSVAHNIAKLMGVVKKKALAVAQADIPAGLVGKLEFAGGNCGYKKPGVKLDAEKWELWKAKDTELQAAEDAYNQAAEVAKQAKFRLDEVQAPFYIRQGRGQFYINNNTKRGKVS